MGSVVHDCAQSECNECRNDEQRSNTVPLLFGHSEGDEPGDQSDKPMRHMQIPVRICKIKGEDWRQQLRTHSVRRVIELGAQQIPFRCRLVRITAPDHESAVSRSYYESI